MIEIDADTTYGVVADIKDFDDGSGEMIATRVRLIDENPVWWYLICGQLPKVGDTVKVRITKNGEPYIDSTPIPDVEDSSKVYI